MFIFMLGDKWMVTSALDIFKAKFSLCVCVCVCVCVQGSEFSKICLSTQAFLWCINAGCTPSYMLYL